MSAKELIEAPYVSTVLFIYDFIRYVPCQDEGCTGYLIPTGPPVLAPKWGGGVKYPFRCSERHTAGHISRSSIEERGMKLTWAEIRRLKEILKR